MVTVAMAAGKMGSNPTTRKGRKYPPTSARPAHVGPIMFPTPMADSTVPNLKIKGQGHRSKFKVKCCDLPDLSMSSRSCFPRTDSYQVLIHRYKS